MCADLETLSETEVLEINIRFLSQTYTHECKLCFLFPTILLKVNKKWTRAQNIYTFFTLFALVLFSMREMTLL
jgi:hypothetical protein